MGPQISHSKMTSLKNTSRLLIMFSHIVLFYNRILKLNLPIYKISPFELNSLLASAFIDYFRLGSPGSRLWDRQTCRKHALEVNTFRQNRKEAGLNRGEDVLGWPFRVVPSWYEEDESLCPVNQPLHVGLSRKGMWP